MARKRHSDEDSHFTSAGDLEDESTLAEILLEEKDDEDDDADPVLPDDDLDELLDTEDLDELDDEADEAGVD